jgi:tripartite-type tricarboxylate transporter receptor subunit TctC
MALSRGCKLHGILAGVAFVAVFTAQACSAEEVADFYRGRQMQIVIGSSVGGGYDAYGRLLARFLPKHIPGNPTAIPQNMPGAGSRSASNWLYNIAPKDGSVLGVTSQAGPLDQAFHQEGVQFDAAKFNWIGNPVVDNQVTITWAATGIETIADLIRKNDLVCGATGANTNPVIFPKLINELTGANIKVVMGYQGAAAAGLAMERGEVGCLGSHSWSTAKATMGHFLKERKMNVLVQWGPGKDPEISAYAMRDVPLIVEFARNDQDREVLTLFNSSMSIGRPLLAPPDVPRARVDALRKAFDETMQDPEFLAEAKRLNLDIRPLAGIDLQKLATDVSRASPETVARARDLLK